MVFLVTATLSQNMTLGVFRPGTLLMIVTFGGVGVLSLDMVTSTFPFLMFYIEQIMGLVSCG